MAVVKVPRTPKRAFNKDRRPSALLLDQIRHLEWAALPASQRKPKDLKKYRTVKTEAQAAERVAQLTTLIQQTHERERTEPPRSTGVQPTVMLPQVPRLRSNKKRLPSKPDRMPKPRDVRGRRTRSKGSR